MTVVVSLNQLKVNITCTDVLIVAMCGYLYGYMYGYLCGYMCGYLWLCVDKL